MTSTISQDDSKKYLKVDLDFDKDPNYEPNK